MSMLNLIYRETAPKLVERVDNFYLSQTSSREGIGHARRERRLS